MIKNIATKIRLGGLLCMTLAAIANSLLAAEPQQLSYQILAERSHKPSLFTQGLQLDNNTFYESSGLYGKSQLVSYPVAEPKSKWAQLTAPFTHKQALPERFFGEGLTLLGDKAYLLTWQAGVLMIFNKADLSYDKSLNYSGEGWGLTSDGKWLIRSDGSDQLFFHQASDFKQVKSLHVKRDGEAVDQLNELEYAEGFIWANIWHQDKIIKIDAHSGAVVAEVDLSVLSQGLKLNNDEAVLNGIAWDANTQGFWVTGKLWPKMFLIILNQSNAEQHSIAKAASAH